MVGLTNILALAMMAPLCSGQYSGRYSATRNMSSTTFSSMVQLTVKAGDHLACSHQCEAGLCNSYHYEETTGSCHLADLTFLEDPAPGETALAIMVDTGVVESLEMKCRGGAHCCVRNNVRMCQSGERDCQADIDCGEVLICGENNCNNQADWARQTVCSSLVLYGIRVPILGPLVA